MNGKNAYKVFGEKPLTSGVLASSSPTKLEENLFLYHHGNDHEKTCTEDKKTEDPI